MKIEQKLAGAFPIISSSQNPEEISLMLKGLVLSLVSLIMIIVKLLGFEAGEEIIQGIINSILVAVGAVLAIIGFVRKIKR